MTSCGCHNLIVKSLANPPRWCAAAVITATCVALFCGHAAGAEGGASAVRVLNPVIATTLEQAYPVSPTLRAVVDELNRSDLIMHVVALRVDYRRHLSGSLKFVNRAGGRRFVRVAINHRLPQEYLVAALGHELHHALEIARSSTVIDQDTLGTLYRTIGYRTPNSCRVCYETEEAQRIGARVREEFQASAAAPQTTRLSAADGSR
jgi:hypothetical protein